MTSLKDPQSHRCDYFEHKRLVSLNGVTRREIYNNYKFVLDVRAEASIDRDGLCFLSAGVNNAFQVRCYRGGETDLNM